MKTLKAGILLMAFVLAAPAARAETRNAPDFTLKDLKGNSVRLEDFRAGKKAVLLNFWATWCPACRKEIPELMELNKKLSERGFAVLGIDAGEPAQRAASYVEKHRVDYPVLTDPDSSVAKSYGIVGLPTSVLIGADGRVAGEYHEYSDELVAAVERALR